MARITFLWGVIFLAVPVFAHAKDYPLEFKTLSASEAKGYDWSYGAIKMIVATRPVGLKNEPASMSPHPLYGNFEWPSDTTSLLFRLDESQGEGKGYDCLILDLNHNGDLTDDAAIFPAANFERRSAFEGQESTLFGPIKAPASKSIGISEPIYYAVLDVRRDALMKLRDRQKTANAGYLGNLRLKAAWCLETTVELGGIKHRIALIDNDANMRLGVLRKARPSDGGWFLRAAEGDRLLLAKGESGAYGFPLPFAPILYLGATPCMATLAADCRSIQIEPWPEPLAEVSLLKVLVGPQEVA